MEFTAILRGLSFRPIDAKAYAQTLAEGDGLLLERDPGNQFDANAIKVLSPDGVHWIGFVAKEVAVELAPEMDAGKHFLCYVDSNMMKQITLFIKEITGEEEAVRNPAEVSTDGPGFE